MSFDVVLFGEILVELYCDRPLADGTELRLGFSGDTLNAAAAAAAAGARTAIVTAVGQDELGDAILRRVRELGVDTSLIRRSSSANGAYLLHGDLTGHREFTYWRKGSAASTVDVDDIGLVADRIERAGAVVLTGIAAALSETTERATVTAARIAAGGGAAVVYDPNFRRRLTTPRRARQVLAEIAPYCALVTPSCPGDSAPLLDTTDPAVAVSTTRALGAGAAAVTSGLDSVVVGWSGEDFTVPVPVNEHAVDATGAGDVFAGTAAARLALGDPLPLAVRLAVAAASLSVAGRGGTGHIPSLARTRKLAASLVG